MANDSIRGRQVVLRLTNKSAGGVVAGDVVIISSGTAASFTTTTSAGQNADMVGVVLETIAQDALGRVCISGYTPIINLSASASLGDTLATHSVAKQAAPSASRGAGSFGEVLGTGTSPAALLWGVPDGSGGTGVAADSIWDAAGDLAIGTGANTAGRLAIGTAYQYPRVNAGATALEYVTGGRVFIAENSPSGTGTSTFSTISGIFTHLEIDVMARSTQAAVTYEDMRFEINGDNTSTNYRHTVDFGYNTTEDATGGDGIAISVSAANAPANACTVVTLKFPFYALTTFNKQIVGLIGHRRDASSIFELTANISVEWENTAAITDISFILTAGNFVSGSKLRLYGIP